MAKLGYDWINLSFLHVYFLNHMGYSPNGRFIQTVINELSVALRFEHVRFPHDG